MRCENTEDCPARKNPGKPCWEIAMETGSDRHALNICGDCIVRLVKEGNPVLSNQEIMEIMKVRAETDMVDKDLSGALQSLNVLDRFFG
jgi:hypothetical protein